MPTSPSTLSRHRYNRIVAAIPRLEAVLHDLDAIDRKTPLAPGFAGPGRAVVSSPSFARCSVKRHSMFCGGRCRSICSPPPSILTP